MTAPRDAAATGLPRRRTAHGAGESFVSAFARQHRPRAAPSPNDVLQRLLAAHAGHQAFDSHERYADVVPSDAWTHVPRRYWRSELLPLRPASACATASLHVEFDRTANRWRRVLLPTQQPTTQEEALFLRSVADAMWQDAGAGTRESTPAVLAAELASCTASLAELSRHAQARGLTRLAAGLTQLAEQWQQSNEYIPDSTLVASLRAPHVATGAAAKLVERVRALDARLADTRAATEALCARVEAERAAQAEAERETERLRELAAGIARLGDGDAALALSYSLLAGRVRSAVAEACVDRAAAERALASAAAERLRALEASAAAGFRRMRLDAALAARRAGLVQATIALDAARAQREQVAADLAACRAKVATAQARERVASEIVRQDSLGRLRRTGKVLTQ